jgi:hypothetical protein
MSSRQESDIPSVLKRYIDAQLMKAISLDVRRDERPRDDRSRDERSRFGSDYPSDKHQDTSRRFDRHRSRSRSRTRHDNPRDTDRSRSDTYPRESREYSRSIVDSSRIVDRRPNYRDRGDHGERGDRGGTKEWRQSASDKYTADHAKSYHLDASSSYSIPNASPTATTASVTTSEFSADVKTLLTEAMAMHAPTSATASKPSADVAVAGFATVHPPPIYTAKRKHFPTEHRSTVAPLPDYVPLERGTRYFEQQDEVFASQNRAFATFAAHDARRWKTGICPFWARGWCKRTDEACKFAHGIDDRRAYPKY